MSAFGRLWRRAPLWRRIFYGTVVAVALTIAFPPAWLGGGLNLPLQSERRIVVPTEPSGEGIVDAPNQRLPMPAAQPYPSQTVQARAAGLPVAGEVYSGRLPLGSQAVPLPPGRWVALAVADSSSGQSAVSANVNVFLGLVLGGRIAAAAMIGGSTVPDTAGGGFAAPMEAQIPAFYYRRVLSSVDHGALDLWVCGHVMPAHWNDPLRQAAVGAIRQQGLVLADRLDSVVFRLADKRNWISAEFMYPAGAGEPDHVRPWIEAAALSDTGPIGHLEKVRRWGKAWHDIMRRGFDGVLRPGDEARIAPP